MSPTVLYAATFPRRRVLGDDPFGSPFEPHRAPRIDGITEAEVRRVVRDELRRLDDRQAREKQLQELIDALDFVCDGSALSDGDERKQLVTKHIADLRRLLQEE